MFRSWPVLAIGLAVFIFSTPAWADGGADDLARLIRQPADAAAAATEAEKAGSALRLTSNKSALIRLDHDAASIIVNNPDHVSVMLDSPRLLIVMPRQPGTTSFTVLDSNGNVILQKDVIVSNVQQKYVRIRRICAGNDSSCLPAAYYYCPDGCYEVTPVASEGLNAPPPPANSINSAPAIGANVNAGAIPAGSDGKAEAPVILNQEP